MPPHWLGYATESAVQLLDDAQYTPADRNRKPAQYPEAPAPPPEVVVLSAGSQ
jgi:hypothetical protein